MKNNEELQKDVQDAIKREPLLNAAEIGVTAQNGIITLYGVVDSYVKKIEAEDAAKDVEGIRAVVEKIEIHFSNTKIRDDNDIAVDILFSMKLNWEIPENMVKIKVEDGLVSIEGELQWSYQKESVKRVISKVAGVKGITNFIKIVPESNLVQL